MNDDLDCDVAIVGAGPTGLTLANILGRAGLRVLVIERNESTVRAPRAVSIDDESLRTVQSIGLVEEVLRDVACDYGSHYYTAGGRCFAKVEPTTREYGFARRNAFTQPRLEQALLDGVRRFQNVTVLFQHALVAATEGATEVRLLTRTSEGREVSIRARYVAACDGARSTCRKQIGATMGGSTYPQRWLIVDLASTRERLRQTRVVCNPVRPLITLPGPHGIRRYEFMLRDSENDEMATDPAFVRQLLAEHGPDADAPVVRRQVYAFHALIADRWNTRRIYLAGDAAHLSPPFAGQGMNSGLRDAFNLGWKLAAVCQGRLGPRLLETYQQERGPHAWELIQLAVKMGRIMMPKSPLQAALVQNAFRLTRFAPRLQSYFAQMKYKPKPFYHRGFLVPGDGSTLVGRMFPQPLVETSSGQVVLLDELLGSGCRLMAWGECAQQWLAEAKMLDFGWADLRPLAILPGIYNPDRDAPPSIEVVRDLHHALDPILAPGETVAMLLRPDRYVAAATSGSAQAMAATVRQLVERFRDDVPVSRQSAPAAYTPDPALAPAPATALPLQH